MTRMQVVIAGAVAILVGGAVLEAQTVSVAAEAGRIAPHSEALGISLAPGAFNLSRGAELLSAAFGSTAQSQDPVQLTRFTLGGHLDFASPVEEFRDNVDNGVGVGGFARYNIDRRGIFSVRLDGSWAMYGREKKRVPLSNTVGGRILVDVVTTNSLFAFGIGGQLTVPSGPVRPYANVGFAFLGFTTGSSVSGSNFDDEPFASSTNYSDGTTAAVLGTGIVIPVGRDIGIDLALRYHRGGTASYLKEGSIQDNDDGTITITPLESRTPFILYSLGVTWQVGRRSGIPCPPALC